MVVDYSQIVIFTVRIIRRCACSFFIAKKKENYFNLNSDKHYKWDGFCYF